MKTAQGETDEAEAESIPACWVGIMPVGHYAIRS